MPLREETFSLPSYAKINLRLRVLGRRADGYHELQTVFQTITLRDRLTFGPLDSPRLELECDAPDVPSDDSNLVVRAARLLRERFRVGRGARVKLEKSIPAGGGLGASLGADVPFFLTGGTALGTGRGTEITPLRDAPRASLLVVAPRVKISTAEAYKSLNAPALTKECAPVNLLVSREEANFSGSLPSALSNDFEPAIFEQHGEVGRARDALLAAGARAALLSGSGSSVFGLFDGDAEVERARARLRTEEGWRVFPCSTLSREEYRHALGECAKFL